MCLFERSKDQSTFLSPHNVSSPSSGNKWPARMQSSKLLFARFLKIFPECPLFRGRGHRFQWNQKTGSPDCQSGAESGVFGIQFFRVGTGPGNRDRDPPWQTVDLPGKSGPDIAPDYPSRPPFSGILCKNGCNFTHFF